MKKNKVVIHLMGRDYSLLSDQPAEKVQRIARYVDQRMREVAITTRAGDSMVSTLTAVMIADELFRAQDENVHLKRQLAEIQPPEKE